MRDLTEFQRFGHRVEPNLSVGDCVGSRAGPIATDELDWGSMNCKVVGSLASERYRSQSVIVIRIEVNGLPSATH